MKRIVSAAVAVFASCAAGAQTAPPSPASAEDALTRALNGSASRLEAGGIVAALTENGKTQYSMVGNPIPRADVPPERIIFEIGSITKVFTSLLLAQAVVEHKVSLNDPISRFLSPSVKMDPAVGAITLEELATHSSGLPRMPGNFRPSDNADPYADYTAEDLYAFLSSFKPKPPPHPPLYSNLGVGLLGHILTLVYGKPYADLIAEKITHPFGLSDTVIALNAEQLSRFATPYSEGKAIEPWHLAVLAPAGALHSTAADLTHFAEVLMHPEENPLRAAWEIARQPRGALPPDKIGLNVIIKERDHEVVYWHNGGTGGFHTYLEWSPESGHVLVLLEDNHTVLPESIVASVYGPPPTSPAALARRPETPLPPGQAADYVGVYPFDDSDSARYTILVGEGGRPYARVTGQPFAPLFYAGKDRFFYRVVPAEIQFSRSPDGRVSGLTLFQNGREQTCTRANEPVPTVLFLPPAKLREYIGHYDSPPIGSFDITYRDRSRTLFSKFTGQPPAPIFPDKTDHFVYDEVEASITFERAPDGSVTALILHQNGQDLRAKKAAPVPAKAPASDAN